MAIRIRKQKGEGIGGFHYIALCAAESKPMEEDIYLNDGIHTALSEKFDSDFREMGFM